MTRPHDNRSQLVKTAVAGRIAPQRIHPEAMATDRDGRVRTLPGTGGINPGVHVGDLCSRYVSDHLMPGASIEDADGGPAVAGPIHLLACLGNRVRDGQGRGIGVVSGKRGGLAPGFWAPQLVSVELEETAAERLKPGDRIVVEATGRGLGLTDFPDVALLNLSAAALDAMPIEHHRGRLVCSVAAIVPAEAAGAGLGQDGWIGDLEIAADLVTAGSVRDLRFGDLVAFSDIDAATTRHYRPGMMSIGVVSHGPGHAPGHGVGVTMLLSSPAAALVAEVTPGGNLIAFLRETAAAAAGGAT